MEFQLHTAESSPEPAKYILSKTAQAHGFVPNIYKVMAESPMTLAIYEHFHDQMQASAFSYTEQMVVLLTITGRQDCKYCQAMHGMIADMIGFPSESIEDIKQGASLEDERLEALRNFTLCMMDNEGWVSQTNSAPFFKVGFENRHVLEIIAFIAMKTLSGYVNRVAQTPLDDAFAEKKPANSN